MRRAFRRSTVKRREHAPTPVFVTKAGVRELALFVGRIDPIVDDEF